MAFPLYFALTGAEFHLCNAPPNHCGWLACHFSPYGTGITNIPQNLPNDSMLILDDSTPINGHDQALIKTQIQELLSCGTIDSVLLDFQRPPTDESLGMAKALTVLPCPVAVSESYAKDLSCPVFLPPPPLHLPLHTYIAPWQGREIWLEAALGQECVAVTKEGLCTDRPWTHSDNPAHFSQELACHYKIVPLEDEIRFLFHRTREDLDALLALAESLGISRAVGLYQELQ
jgi:hypothetical protein